MKMKIKKEYNRFNVETVVANYHFVTWNIGTLKGRSGEVCEVLHRKKVEVCCIQEVRWKGEGSRALQGYKLIWKGNSKGIAGVIVLVASELVDRIIRVERNSDRVIAVDLVIGQHLCTYSIRCIQCIQWVHARYSRVKGSLKNVESSFICRKCKGELYETR